VFIPSLLAVFREYTAPQPAAAADATSGSWEATRRACATEGSLPAVNILRRGRRRSLEMKPRNRMSDRR